MTVGEVPSRPTSLHPQTRACLQHVIVNNVLATADTRQISACHCEPVRTLVWQSVLLAVVHGKSQHLRRIRNHPRIRPSSSLFARHFCRDADCHVASLLAMTVGEVPSRPTSLHPLTPGKFLRTLRAASLHPRTRSSFCMALRAASLHPRTRPSFCMSLRTSAHTGVAIRVPAEMPGKSVVLRANSLHFPAFAQSTAVRFALPQGMRIVPSLRSSQ